MKRLLLFLSIILAFVVVLSGCNRATPTSQADDTNTQPESSTQAPEATSSYNGPIPSEDEYSLGCVGGIKHNR